MNFSGLLASSVGRKFIMAVTGMLLFLFVLLHLLGNLQVFLGPEAINRYGNLLQTNTELLWPARIILLILVLAHIWSAIRLSVENRAARPRQYQYYEVVAASYASRTMLMSGLIIMAFIIFHLLHFTAQVQAVNGVGMNFESLKDAEGRHDVFAMMILGFRNPYVSAAYIFAMFLLFLHLSHGLSAMFQSLGWRSGAYRPLIDRFAQVFSWLLFLGYVSIPLAILGGYGKPYLLERGLLK